MNDSLTFASSWLHNLDPVIWQISGPIALRWYGLSYATGFVIGWLLLRWLAGRGAVLIPKDRVADAILIVALGTVVGGRLGYVLIYQPELLVSFSGSLPFWGVFAVNKGGMASHGGMVGVILACLFIARGFKDDQGNRVGKVPLLHVTDAMALVAPFGIILGRLANFVNGELLGRVVTKFGVPGPSWAVKYPQEMTERWDELPQEQREALFALAGLPAALIEDDATVEKFQKEFYPGVIDGIREGKAEIVQAIEPLLNARHPSQLYQAIGEGLLVAVVVWVLARAPRKPGVISCGFLVTYGIARIATEFYRLPDAHLATQRMLGMSRGQWLSVAMVVAGAGLMIWLMKRDTPKLGGWANASSAHEDAASSDSSDSSED